MKELLWGRSEPETPGQGPGSAHSFFASFDPFAPPPPSGSLDLRGFIQVLLESRHLTRVKERVDWKLGIGRWTRSRRKPLLFENIKDYPDQRVFTNGLLDPLHIGMALGFHGGLPPARVIAQARRRVRDPIAPKMVRNGPVLENVVPASVLDLLQFPVPRWSDYDDGRYIGTWHLNVSKDPETGERSAGVYRMKSLGPKQATINASKRSALARHLAKAEAKKAELPMAMVIGAPEATVIAASAACPAGMDAYDLAGALQQKPVELIECMHLELPAFSEIVIEGFIHPGVRVEDGPYIDHGRPRTNPRAFLFEATRVMHRDNPIFRGSASSKEGAEDQQIRAFLTQLKLAPTDGSWFKQMVHSLFG
ncbi:MAG TPA: UbiD family decarboxylase [Acidobacteriaceae bacterium]|nr:UbiD family decarboxylase [Acidobacteriaceae bacterium]